MLEQPVRPAKDFEMRAKSVNTGPKLLRELYVQQFCGSVETRSPYVALMELKSCQIRALNFIFKNDKNLDINIFAIYK